MIALDLNLVLVTIRISSIGYIIFQKMCGPMVETCAIIMMHNIQGSKSQGGQDIDRRGADLRLAHSTKEQPNERSSSQPSQVKT